MTRKRLCSEFTRRTQALKRKERSTLTAEIQYSLLASVKGNTRKVAVKLNVIKTSYLLKFEKDDIRVLCDQMTPMSMHYNVVVMACSLA